MLAGMCCFQWLLFAVFAKAGRECKKKGKDEAIEIEVTKKRHKRMKQRVETRRRKEESMKERGRNKGKRRKGKNGIEM